MFRAEPSEAVNWEITLRDSVGDPVRVLTGSGSMIEESWTGDDAGGDPLGSGPYSYVILAQSQAHPEKSASLVGRLVLDRGIPLARINSPGFFDIEGNSIPIFGTADADSFDSYVIEYGIAEYPLSWTVLDGGSSPVPDGLLATWNATGVDQPRYTLRLTVLDQQGRAARDSVLFDVLSIYDLSDSVDPFSPNGDFIKDNTAISAILTHDADWTLSIRDGDEILQRTITGQGTLLNAQWDGRNDSSDVVPDGTYSYMIGMLHTPSGSTATSLSGVTDLDTTPPTVEITSIPLEGYVSGIEDITGTSDDWHFSSYRVEYGVGSNPVTWHALLGSTPDPVVDGTLVVWDVYPLENGDYVLRLVADDTAGNVNDYRDAVLIDNIQITEVSAGPQFFNPRIGGEAGIHYTLDRDADVTLRIYDHVTSSLARTLVDMTPRPEGLNSEIWDGTDELGEILPLDVYDYTIYAQNDQGRFGRHDPIYVSGSVAFLGSSMTPAYFNPHSGGTTTLGYSLISPAWTTVRIGVSGELSAERTLITSRPSDRFGSTEAWDGRDDSGDILSAATYVAYAWTSILPDNAIVTQDRDLGILAVTTDPYAIYPRYGMVVTVAYSLSEDAYVTIHVTDPGDVHVRTLLDEELQAEGPHTALWDAKDDLGKFVSQEGNYEITVTATDTTQTTTVTRIGNATVFK